MSISNVLGVDGKIVSGVLPNPYPFPAAAAGLGAVLAVSNNALTLPMTNVGNIGCADIQAPFGAILAFNSDLIGGGVSGNLGILPAGNLTLKGAQTVGSLLVGDGTSTVELALPVPPAPNGSVLIIDNTQPLGVRWGGESGPIETITSGNNIDIVGTSANPIVQLQAPLTSGLNMGVVAITDSAASTGTVGQVLSCGAGATTLWATLAAPNLVLNDQITNYTLVATDVNKRVIMDVAAANTITVNSGVFVTGDTVFIANQGAGITTITDGSGVTVNSASGKQLEQYRSALLLAFSASNFSLFMSAGIVPDVLVEYLVIAGGGGGGSGNGPNNGGGAGAGGYRCSVVGEQTGGGGVAEEQMVLRVSILYTITVGNGGASTPNALNGGNSSIVSSFYNITATGGGAGATFNAGGDGGSSGGGRGGIPTAAGVRTPAPVQGFNGSNGGGLALGFIAGGGGGAGDFSSNADCIAGDGLFSSITGVSTQRGGGGAGGANSGASLVGGAGGGGNGSNGVIAATAGIVNTGGGGGGGHNTFVFTPGAVGGRGIVVLRTPSTAPTAQLTGGGTFDGSVVGFKIYTFLTSGTIAWA